MLGIYFIFLASISDYWDGFLARKYNLNHYWENLDPIADKILATFLILALSIELSSIFIGMLVALCLLESFGLRFKRLKCKTWKSDATKVTFLAKDKTSIQFLNIFSFLLWT